MAALHFLAAAWKDTLKRAQNIGGVICPDAYGLISTAGIKPGPPETQLMAQVAKQ